MDSRVITYNGSVITPAQASRLAEGLRIEDSGGSLVLTYNGTPITPEIAEQIVRAAEFYIDENDLKAQLREQGIREGDRVLYGTGHHMYTYNGYHQDAQSRSTKAHVQIFLNGAGRTHYAGTPLRKVHSRGRLMENIPMAVHRRTARNVVTKGLGLSAYSPVGKTMQQFLGPTNLFVQRPPHSNRRRAGSNVAAEFRKLHPISEHSSESRSSRSRRRRSSSSSSSRRRRR